MQISYFFYILSAHEFVDYYKKLKQVILLKNISIIITIIIKINNIDK